MRELQISDLAVIGDRRTAAIVSRSGDILWYCPDRFDGPSLFAGLLDETSGGAWRMHVDNAEAAGRRYLGDSGILETRLATPDGDMTVVDWMTIGQDAPTGAVCRTFSPRPASVRFELEPRPDYARGRVDLRQRSNTEAVVNDAAHFYASHPVRVEGATIAVTLPPGEGGWAVLSGAPLDRPTRTDIDRWHAAALDEWSGLAALIRYRGPYEREIAASLRAIRLLTHEPTGGIVAAATASLPEVPGGRSNWDYRYVWLRDAGMIVSALTRLGGDAREGERYLDFICSSRGSSSRYPVAVFTRLDGEPAPEEGDLDLAGFCGSRPARIGNGARDQLQLDAFANVLLAAKLIYGRTDRRPHWDTVQAIAEFLVEHWGEPDHGIWEEPVRRQYTAGKVIVACALDSIAEYCADESQAARWRAAVADIRRFVADRCLTSEGAYAVFAGSDDVDVSAALFPVWNYTAADAPEMEATIAALEAHWSHEGLLYWRRLECADSREEGAFLAGTFWVAQYWIMRGDQGRARRIIEAGLACANDLGLFAEEFDPRHQQMLGNFPQSFVHASFIGAVIDLALAERGPG